MKFYKNRESVCNQIISSLKYFHFYGKDLLEKMENEGISVSVKTEEIKI